MVLGLGKKLYNEPLNLISQYYSSYGNLEIVTERVNFLKSVKHGRDQSPNIIYNKIVIVIGESVNKHHMGIYGHDADTTPFLSRLEDKNMYRFNAISSVNQTAMSLPMLLTGATVENFRNGYIRSISLMDSFNIAGYKTNWISNQGKVGGIETLISSIAKETSSQIYLNKGHYSKSKKDQGIIDYLKTVPIDDKLEMSIIHLMGSHFDYTKRYSEEHSLFKKTKNLAEQYDNTIFYTDYILKNIYEQYKNNSKLLFIYIADHGEIVHKNKYGHGFNPAYKDEYDVPFIIYSSIDNKRLKKVYQENKKHYFNSENMSNIVQYVAGLSDDINISYSPNVLCIDSKNIIDYDKLLFYNE